VGETFKINFTASGKGVPNYTVQINASFNPDVVSFSRWQWNGGGNLIPLKTSGYNVLDNTTGTIVQTTGYTEGFTGIVNLADATFVAKKEGVAVIHINPESFSYDETSTNTYVQGQNTYAYVQVLPALKKQVKEKPKETTVAPTVSPSETAPTASSTTPSSTRIPTSSTPSATSPLSPEDEPGATPRIVKVQFPVPTPENSETELFTVHNLTFFFVGMILGVLLLKLFESIGPEED
jgi:hypothetical protein